MKISTRIHTQLLGLSLIGVSACPGDGGNETGGTSTGVNTGITSSTSSTGNGTEPSTTEPTTTEPSTTTGTEPCDPNIICGINEVCIDGPAGNCVCKDDWVLCGATCVDLRTDVDHCGTCNNGCGTSTCVSGICSEVGPAGGIIEAPVIIGGAEGVEECVVFNEAKPEHSINHALNGIAYFVAAQQFAFDFTQNGWFNWSDISSIWEGSTNQIPANSADDTITNDPWSATHGGTGLEYVALFGKRSMEEQCVMVAATDAGSMASGIWTHPFDCATPPEEEIGAKPDGPVIVSDYGDNALCIAYVRSTLSTKNLIVNAIRRAWAFRAQTTPRTAQFNGPKTWKAFH